MLSATKHLSPACEILALLRMTNENTLALPVYRSQGEYRHAEQGEASRPSE
jgi:hypothetical protein